MSLQDTENAMVGPDTHPTRVKCANVGISCRMVELKQEHFKAALMAQNSIVVALD